MATGPSPVERPDEETLDELYENAPCGYLTTDAESVIVRANATLAGWLGVAPGGLVGRRVRTILTQAGRILFETHVAPLLETHGAARQVAIDLRCADGRRIAVLSDWRSVVVDGRTLGWRVMLVDATERRAYERDLVAERELARDTAARLRESEARLLDLNETLEQRVAEREAALRDTLDFSRLALSAVSGVGTWTFDAASDRFFCDTAVSELYGIDAAEGAAGIPRTGFLANVDPDDRRQLDATMKGGLRRGGEIELEYRVRHPNGSTRWVLSRGYTYVDDQGRAVRRTGVAIETTKQRQLEEQFRQSQKMEAVGQLTGGVAHDFNNLLTVVRSSVDLLKRPGLTEERRRRYIDAISDTTERAAKLTGQLLAFARRQALRPEIFDVVKSVATIGDMVISLAGSRIRFETDVVDEPCYVNADPSQFDTALVNLVVNARDAMDGAGTLTIAVRPASIIPARRAHPAMTGDFIGVMVGDTGCGIAPGCLNKIFEPFFTTKEVGKGTGLGLSQVIGFAKQSGGDISVASEVGRGTTFTLYLPRSKQTSAEAVRTGAADPLVDGGGTRVLVVEDNAQVGAFAAQTLAELGCDCVLAADGPTALAELSGRADTVDVVFSDVIMPGMSGVELGQEIRRRYPGLPVILTSGYSHVLAETGTSGFEVLHKPYSIEQLSRVLRNIRINQAAPGPAATGPGDPRP